MLNAALEAPQAHRRDALIEFIKGLLAVPFVLHSQPTASNNASVKEMETEARRRYREIMRDIEGLVNDHSMLRLMRCVCGGMRVLMHLCSCVRCGGETGAFEIAVFSAVGGTVLHAAAAGEGIRSAGPTASDLVAAVRGT